jgi:hypothetical protein
VNSDAVADPTPRLAPRYGRLAVRADADVGRDIDIDALDTLDLDAR